MEKAIQRQTTKWIKRQCSNKKCDSKEALFFNPKEKKDIQRPSFLVKTTATSTSLASAPPRPCLWAEWHHYGRLSADFGAGAAAWGRRVGSCGRW